MHGITLIGVAALFALVSLLLLLGKISMKHFYGCRFPLSFKSDVHWYAINKHGAKTLLWGSLVIVLYGFVGLFSFGSADS